MRTLQETFDIVVKHLMTQKARAIDGDDQCQYKGNDGLKCAIGCLIPDELYQPKMEGHDASDLLAIFPDVASELSVKGVETDQLVGFYSDLQMVHDDSPVDSWYEDLKHLAGRYNLKLSETLYKP